MPNGIRLFLFGTVDRCVTGVATVIG
jgi:hypothetical protein